MNGVSPHVAGNELRGLCSLGMLVQLGRGKSSYYTLAELFDADEIRLEKYFPKEVIVRLNRLQRRVLSIVETFGQINAKQICNQSGYTDERGVKRVISNLVRLNLLIRRGKSRSDPAAYYEINKDYGIKDVELITHHRDAVQLELDLNSKNLLS